jgi:hypothetical protein
MADKPTSNDAAGSSPRRPAAKKTPVKKTASARPLRENVTTDTPTTLVNTKDTAHDSTTKPDPSPEAEEPKDDPPATDVYTTTEPVEITFVERGTVDLTTLKMALRHRQRATGVDRLQEALDLPPTGTPDDALEAAITKYREDADLGDGTLDEALLRRLGFDVV